jgi:hypothetical protein
LTAELPEAIAVDLLVECELTWPIGGELEVGQRQSHF